MTTASSNAQVKLGKLIKNVRRGGSVLILV